MPSKKKKYNARFPPGRIKKIMQTDEEVGKVAQAVPIIISKTLELFVESLLTKTLRITNSRHAKTLSPSHMKQCIMSESRFDFLRELVKNVPDINVAEEASSRDSSSPGPPNDLFDPATVANVGSVTPVSTFEPNFASSSNGNNTFKNGNRSVINSIISDPIKQDYLNNKSSPSSSMCYGRQLSMDLSTTAHSGIGNDNNKLDYSMKTIIPNFYKEISTTTPSTSATNSVIQYSSKSGLRSDKNSSNNDKETIKPPKFGRYDSAPANYYSPATMSIADSNITSRIGGLGDNGKEGDAESNPYSNNLGKIPNAHSSSTPILRLDLTKKFLSFPYPHDQSPNSPSVTQNSCSSPQSQQNNPPLNLIKNSKQKQLTSNSSKDIPTPPPIVKIDISNTPVVKIDYSHLTADFLSSSSSSPLSTLSTITTISTATTPTATITFSQDDILTKTPVININLGNFNNMSTGNIKMTSSASKTSSGPTVLEMDEDYDNI